MEPEHDPILSPGIISEKYTLPTLTYTALHYGFQCYYCGKYFQSFGLRKHSGESQGTQDEFLATYNNHAPGESCS